MTCTVPEPVIVPCAPPPLTTTVAAGLKVVPDPPVNVPPTFRLVLAESVPLPEVVRLLNEVVLDPAMVPVPVKVTVPDPAVNVPLLVKLPPKVSEKPPLSRVVPEPIVTAPLTVI